MSTPNNPKRVFRIFNGNEIEHGVLITNSIEIDNGRRFRARFHFPDGEFDRWAYWSDEVT